MASGAPERPVVLRRLGLIKDENDTAFLQPPPAAVDVAEDGLESFGSESGPGFFNAVADRAGALLAYTARKPWVVIGVLSVVFFVATLLLINILFGPAEPPIAASVNPAASSDATAAPVTTEPSPATAVGSKPARPAAVKPPASRTAPTPVRPTTVVQSSSKAPPADIVRRSDTRSTVAPPVAAETAAAGGAVGPAQDVPFVDDRIYSSADTDVVPPRTSETLPGPTISSWTTRTNVVELIVSDDGTVERARFVTPPQRMPDVLALSRAKVWKFTPAMKDGRPVRYRLLLKWEVNP